MTSTRISCGKCAPTTSSDSPISRANISAARRRPPEAAAVALALADCADVLLQARQGPLPQGAAGRAQGRARVGRAQEARGRADRRVERRAFARTGCPTRFAPSCRCCCTSRTRTRSNGRRSPPRATRCRPTRLRFSRNAARFRRRTITTTMRFSRRLFRAASRSPHGARCPACPSCRRRDVRAFSIDDATTTEIDDAFSVRELAERQLRGRHPHRCAGARDSARIAARRHRARAAVHRLHARPQDHDAARRGGRRLHARRGARAARAVALCRSRGRRDARSGTRRASNRVPVAANLRLDAIDDAFANDAAVAGRPAMDGGAARAVEVRAGALGQARGKADFPRIDYSFYVDWDARAATANACRSSRGRAARPLDKLVSELMILVNSTWGKAARRRARRRASTGRSRTAR